MIALSFLFFFFQAEDGIRDATVTGVQTCALPIYPGAGQAERPPALGEVPVVADVHADPADRGVEDRVAHVARPEVELLPERSEERRVGKECRSRRLPNQ